MITSPVLNLLYKEKLAISDNKQYFFHGYFCCRIRIIIKSNVNVRQILKVLHKKSPFHG